MLLKVATISLRATALGSRTIGDNTSIVDTNL